VRGGEVSSEGIEASTMEELSSAEEESAGRVGVLEEEASSEDGVEVVGVVVEEAVSSVEEGATSTAPPSFAPSASGLFTTSFSLGASIDSPSTVLNSPR